MSILATDNFNRADGPIGANWGDVTGANAPFSVVGNAAFSDNSSVASRYTAVTAPSNQYSKVTLSTLQATSDEGCGPAVRMASGSLTMYLAQCNTTEIKCYKAISASFTQLGSNAAAGAPGDVIEIDANGSSITVKKNGSIIIGPITDSDIATGDWGMWGSTSGSASTQDNWEGGDFAGAETITMDKWFRQASEPRLKKIGVVSSGTVGIKS